MTMTRMLLAWWRSTAQRVHSRKPFFSAPSQHGSVRTACPGLESLEERLVLSSGPFGKLLVFGDSLADVGNVSAATGGALPPSQFYYHGRSSNGPIWVDTLASYMDEPALQPSLLGGTDYAWDGATVAAAEVGSSTGVPTLPQQVAAYTAGKPTIAPNDVFAFWAGANDYFNTFSTGAIAPSLTASTLTASLQALYQAGARTFVVNNLPLLGNTP